MHKLILGLGGSSGSIYARLMLDRLAILADQWEVVDIVMSRNAEINWNLEIKDRDIRSYGHRIYDQTDFTAPFASGSARYGTMIL